MSAGSGPSERSQVDIIFPLGRCVHFLVRFSVNDEHRFGQKVIRVNILKSTPFSVHLLQLRTGGPLNWLPVCRRNVARFLYKQRCFPRLVPPLSS